MKEYYGVKLYCIYGKTSIQNKLIMHEDIVIVKAYCLPETKRESFDGGFILTHYFDSKKGASEIKNYYDEALLVKEKILRKPTSGAGSE